MELEVDFVVINDPDHKTRQGFAELYQAAFAEPPYFEGYTVDDVINKVWLPHIMGNHCVVVALYDGEIIGLGCAHAADDDLSTIGAFLQEVESGGTAVPFPLPKTIYMSELAVSRSARGLGIGTSLVKRRLLWGAKNGFTHYCMRTAAEGSNSRGLYERLGASVAPFTQDVRNEGVESQSESRIILYGNI